MTVVALVTDLFFGTKIRSTADAVGVPVKMVRSTGDLLASAADASIVLVDLNAAGVDAVDAVAQVKGQRPDVPVVAFLSHVQHELAGAAQAAGAEVLSRSVFSARLPEILRSPAGG